MVTTPPDALFATYRDAVEARLDALIPHTGAPSDAARHSLLLPGKRLRALLTMASAADHGADPMAALDAACAVEMVHTASLVFDDLPAMDDASLRRGAVTPHVMYGEGVAILAGIGLLNGAYGVLASYAGRQAGERAELARLLTDAVGWHGLVQGQALDLASDAARAETADVADIHHGKTGVLFVAAADMGAVIAGANAAARPAMVRLGHWLGQAYQAFDDVVDAVASAEDAGKPTGADGRKATALAVSQGGIADARARASAALQSAREYTPTTDHPSQLDALLVEIDAHFTRLIAPHLDAA